MHGGDFRHREMNGGRIPDRINRGYPSPCHATSISPSRFLAGVMPFEQAGQERAGGFGQVLGMFPVMPADQGVQFAAAGREADGLAVHRVQHAVDVAVVEAGAVAVCVGFVGVDRLSFELEFGQLVAVHFGVERAAHGEAEEGETAKGEEAGGRAPPAVRGHSGPGLRCRPVP